MLPGHPTTFSGTEKKVSINNINKFDLDFVRNYQISDTKCQLCGNKNGEFIVSIKE